MRLSLLVLALASVLALGSSAAPAGASISRRACGQVHDREVWAIRAVACKTARTVASSVLAHGHAKGWKCGSYETGERFCSRGSRRPTFPSAELHVSGRRETE